eukprot:g13397.t1
MSSPKTKRGIMTTEGFGGLFKGAAPTSVRAMALNLGMLGGNTAAKDFFLSQNVGLDKTSTAGVFGALAIAGFFPTAACATRGGHSTHSHAGSASTAATPTLATTPLTNAPRRRYLVWFAHHNLYYNMRFQELESLAGMCGLSKHQLYYGVDVEEREHSRYDYPCSLSEDPFVYVWLPIHEAEKIVDFWLGRAVLIKLVVEVWADSADYAVLKTDLKKLLLEEQEVVADNQMKNTTSSAAKTSNYTGVPLQLEEMRGHVRRDRSFCFRCQAFGKTLSQDYKQAKIVEMSDFLWGPPPTSGSSSKVATEETPAHINLTSARNLAAEDSEMLHTGGGLSSSSSRASKKRRTSDDGAPPRGAATPAQHHEPQELFERPYKIDLEAADCMLMLLEDYGLFDSHRLHKTLRRVFLGRHLGSGRTHLMKGAAAATTTSGTSRSTTSSTMIKSKTSSLKSLAFYEQYALGKRCVLGPTTMENELAFLMANCAQVSRKKIAMDPFCGTGGLLIPMAHFGTLTFGSDLDIRVLKGWRIAYQKNAKKCAEICNRRFGFFGQEHEVVQENARPLEVGVPTQENARPAEQSKKPAIHCHSGQTAVTTSTTTPTRASSPPPPSAAGERGAAKKGHQNDCKDVFMNFYQYGLKRPEIVVTDNARGPWRTSSSSGVDRKNQKPWLDAIVTDPPYGIRAASKKVGHSGESDKIYDRRNYIPRKGEYEEEEILHDLLTFAADSLVDDGRLVFLLPIDLTSHVERQMKLKEVDSGVEVGEVGDDGRKVDGNKDDSMTATVSSLKSLRDRVLPKGGNVAEEKTTASSMPADATNASGSKKVAEQNKSKKEKNRDWFTNDTREPMVLDERTFTLLCGIALLLYGMRGALRSWRGTLKCRILLRAFGFFELQERTLQLKELKKRKRLMGQGHHQRANARSGRSNDNHDEEQLQPEDDFLVSGEDHFLRLTQLNKEKAACIEKVLCYGEYHMSEMMADQDEAPSTIFKGTWLVACLLFMQVRFQDMHFVSRQLVSLSYCRTCSGVGGTRAPVSAEGLLAPPAIFLPGMVLFRYMMDLLRLFTLVAGLLFCVFIPRARRKDYWVYNLPEEVTDQEVKQLLRNRNVSFLSSDIWHGWSALIAGACGGDWWARFEIGHWNNVYVWFHDRNEALRRVAPSLISADLPGPGGEVVVDAGAHHQQQAAVPFQFYDPISECSDGAVKWWRSWLQFNKCAPFLPTGEKMWTVTLAMRLVTIGISLYRGLRAEVAIVKTGAWEAAFIGIGVWYAPLSLNDYLLWGNMPTVSFFLMVSTLVIFLALFYELSLTFSALCVDFEYPECTLVRKFDKSWRAYEKILEKHLKQVKSTRRQKPSRDDPRFLELLELAPDELELGQVLLYQWNPDGTRFLGAGRSTDADELAGPPPTL